MQSSDLSMFHVYQYASAPHRELPVTKLEEGMFHMHILPEWILTPLVKKHGLASIYDYGKLRDVCSIRDTAIFFLSDFLIFEAFQKYKFLQNASTYTSSIFDDYSKRRYSQFKMPMSTEQRIEYESTMRTYEHDETLKASILDRYCPKQENSDAACEDIPRLNNTYKWAENKPVFNNEDKPYLIYTYQEKVYVGAKENFLNYTADAKNFLTWIQDVLKALYAVHEVSQVNNSIWYDLYFACLEDQTI